jgi:hypothetical protein
MIRFNPYLNGFWDTARQWPDDVRRRIDAATARAAARRRAVRTPHDAAAYQRQVRDAFWSGMGGLPETPRNCDFRECGSVEHLGVEITRLLFDAHPDVPVSAALYRPRGVSGRRPAVVFLSGHHNNAKHNPEYQRVCLDLALHGLVVLAVDPWGQGERWQYATADRDEPAVAPSVYEHSYCGLQCFLAGRPLASYFAWDAVRAVDVLGALAYVDPERIGVTGNSGGGTQTVLHMMADPRLAAAMPCTYVHGMSTYYRAGLPHDAEQNFVGSLASAVDHADLLAAFAPRPLQVGAVSYDFFPIEVTEQTVSDARLVYDAYGAAGRLTFVVDDSLHWYSDGLREQAVRFFTRVLDGQERYERREIATLPEEQLWASPTGQVHRDFPGSRTVFDLNREFLAERRPPPPASADEARQRLRRILAWSADPAALPIRPRFFAPATRDGRTEQQFFFFAEPDVAVAGTLLRPEGGEGLRDDALTWIVLLPEGTASDAADLDPALDLVRQGHRVCLFDPRGRGAVKSHPTFQRRGYDSWLGFEAYTSYMEMLLGGSTVASRVFDVARAIEFVARHAPSPAGVGIRGHGVAALWGYLAAGLDERVRATHVTGMLPSWSEVVETRLYDPETITAAMAVPGVLQHLDLPDLRQCFAGRDLRVEAPLRVAVDPDKLPLKP